MRRYLLLILFFFTSTYLVKGQQIIETIAGIPQTSGYSGDSGKATDATLNNPIGLAMDKKGNLYIADVLNNCIRKMDKSGIITTVAGNGQSGYSGDGGPAIDATFNYPFAIAIDASDNLFICDYLNNRIRKINTSGIITTVAGNGNAGLSGDGGPAIDAELNLPDVIAFDKEGNIYVSGYLNSRIRKINTAGIITTIAGTGAGNGFSGDGGLAINADFGIVRGIAIDNNDNIYFTDFSNNMIRKIDPAGIITKFAGSPNIPYGAWEPDAAEGALGDTANIEAPMGIAVDKEGNVYFSEEGSCVRKINTAGIITTVAGQVNSVFSFSDQESGYAGDGGPATAAKLFSPWGLLVRQTGLYIADMSNHIIRYVKFGPCPTIEVPVNISNDSVFTVQGDFDSYQWLLNGQPITGAVEPVYTATVSGQYAVLVTTDYGGCPNNSNQYLLAKETNLFIPTLFTPNGDSKNDVFKVYGNHLNKVRMMIFNQWGQMIYETSDGQHTGWDGTSSGKPQPVTVYIYVVEATLQDGSVIKRKGSISLVR